MSDSPVYQGVTNPPGAWGGESSSPTRPPSGLRHGSSPLNESPLRVVAAWILSLGLHVVLLMLMFAVVFPFTSSEADAPPPDVRVRISGRLEAASNAPVPTPHAPIDAVPIDSPPVRFEPDKKIVPSTLIAPRKTELDIIGIGSGGGDFDDVGLSIGSDEGPEFFGVGSTARAARRIVYVVDRSGSMIDTFDYVRNELKRSISALRRSQKFHIIFFNTGAPLENPPRKLVSAIAVNKREAFAFLDSVIPRGGTQPERALARAFDLEPDLIYLLSDGVDFDPGLPDKLKEWNRQQGVQVCTIAYIDPGGRKILEQIAREHGGEFKYVSEYDLP